MPKIDLKKRSSWKTIIDAQELSGLTIKNYCLQNNIKAHQFIYYKSILASTPQDSGFIRVVEKPSPALPSSSITVFFRNISISFEGDHSPESLASFCMALGTNE